MQGALRIAGAMAFFLTACASQDIPQAYRGRMFDRTGLFALYAGGKGLTGPVLGPGTYFTGMYDELRVVQCSMVTQRESLTALTRDGVQFGLDVYVRFAANCSDASVRKVLERVVPDQSGAITAAKLYEIFIRPELGVSVREVVSPFRANDINEQRELVMSKVRERFMRRMRATESDFLVVYDVSLSNLDFPDAMDEANVERAVQAVLKDKAIAQRERVKAEIETARLTHSLAEQEADNIAIRIQRVGDALRKYPEYLQYDLQNRMPDIYREAGAQGNLVIAAPNPVVAPPATRTARATTAGGVNSIAGHGPAASHPNPLTGHEQREPSTEP